MAVVQDSAVVSIAETARACLDAFQHCLEHTKQHNPRSHSSLEDQLGRFSIWASSIGAFAPRRASLDHRLRMASDVQRLVYGLLQTLNEHLRAYLSHASQPSPDQDLLGTALEPISKDITLLHRLSNSIRRASRESQNQRAATDFNLTDEEGNDVGLIFRDLFARELIARKFPGCSDTLRVRLASAMLLRRKRILYRRSRHNQLIETKDTTQTVERKGPSTARSKASSGATTVIPEQFKRVSMGPLVTRASTLRLTASESTLFPPAPKARLVRRLKSLGKDEILESMTTQSTRQFETLSINNDDEYQHPSVKTTELDLDKSVEHDDKPWYEGNYEVACPYCCCMLSSTDVMDDNKWRNHVKHDLDAYVCLFEDCNSADTLYDHSDEWLKHMRGHKVRWRCTAKAHGVIYFATQDEYIKHIRTKHKASEPQVQFLAASSGRSSGPIFNSCPLCGVSEVSELSGGLEDHIAAHLRYLALKSLPFIDEGNNDATDVSVNSSVADGGSRNTLSEEFQYDSPMGPSDHIPAKSELEASDDNDHKSRSAEGHDPDSPVGEGKDSGLTMVKDMDDELEIKLALGSPSTSTSSTHSDPPPSFLHITRSMNHPLPTALEAPTTRDPGCLAAANMNMDSAQIEPISGAPGWSSSMFTQPAIPLNYSTALLDREPGHLQRRNYVFNSTPMYAFFPIFLQSRLLSSRLQE
ncbi:hypothetical protein BJX68DRAFT_269784 [Aspergillus pseudodeflectus]|uniref:C2H2-type domain-containing protein n=1 Tax=Aspergillus pseudodeflectus TaxID=176178 RepID=A0ABR4JZB5_9EURO